ncbi:lipopolysaccharide-induced tumor necrosis factor-alpha factor homolog [Glossina fuscipes]|uniref:Lipopolysaccharide-induced tumor necrosis factor-alpha factor homolog n=1 Tax=Glossina fuscipes TaxID=7396 RepID=A0A9C5Z7E2_9MUSC|nr:lipopolysaccharide-induced tumor necrosis factor-alpha factor homolog [Glossina fuscipes]XP_037895341.1 lipopolysaccharide-induced tumor necrosis factor-alpha factor homolog [Glossina fuscipes]
MSTLPLGDEPTNIVCPRCGQSVLTKLNYKATTRTHIIALILCLMGCWFCAPVLYCTRCARNIEHYCPNCNAFLGIYDH